MTNDNFIVMVAIANGVSKQFIDPTVFTVRAVQETLVNFNDTTTGLPMKKLI